MTSPDQNYTSWHCGMKVVYFGPVGTDARSPSKELGEAILLRGSIYTIRDILTFGEAVAVRLEEVVNQPRLYLWDDGKPRVVELAYYANNFRPVQTRKTDISIFTAMLSPKPSRAGKVRA